MNLRPLSAQVVQPAPLQVTPEQALQENLQSRQEMDQLQRDIQQQQERLRQQHLQLISRPVPGIITPPSQLQPFTPSPATSSSSTATEEELALPMSPGPSWRF